MISIKWTHNSYSRKNWRFFSLSATMRFASFQAYRAPRSNQRCRRKWGHSLWHRCMSQLSHPRHSFRPRFPLSSPSSPCMGAPWLSKNARCNRQSRLRTDGEWKRGTFWLWWRRFPPASPSPFFSSAFPSRSIRFFGGSWNNKIHAPVKILILI